MARQMKDSGIDWLGEIPDDWDVIKLKYLFSIISGNGFPDALQGNTEGDYPFCKVSDINGEADYVDTASNWVSQFVVDSKQFNVIPIGSIIMAKIGAALRKNHRKINAVKCCIDNNTQALVPRRNDDLRYLLYLSKCIDMSWFDNSSTVPSINNPKLLNFFIPDVPLDEQQRIADFLDEKCARIDSVVAKTRASIDEYRKLKQSVITRAVTKGIRPNRQMKDSGIEWLGDIPADWETLSFTKSLCSIVDYRGKTPEKQEEGTLLVTARNIKDGKIDYDCSREFVRTEDFDEIMHRGKVEIGDVLFTTEAPLGSVANADRTDFALAQRIIKFRGFPDVLDNYYLKYWIMSDAFQQNLATFSTGSTAKGIKASKLGMLKQVLPPLDEQKEIADYLDEKTAAIDSLIAKKNQLVTELESLKKSLIFEYVTGKKEVPT